MDMLDRYLGYERWTLRHFIVRCQELTPAQLHRRFDIGPETVYDTMNHIIGNIEVWTDLMRERQVRDLPKLPDEIEVWLQRFDAAMADFDDFARIIVDSNRLDDTYLDVLDNPPTRKTFGGTILHVLTHTTVHRWEVQHMVQRLGLGNLIEGDALSWDTRAQRQEL
ncbi:MAG TPA: DinB family protein [Ktedonobacterales bacterium]|jgi:uncharacterized damage-inducible protein DinB